MAYSGPVRIKLDCGHVQQFSMSEAREIKRIRETRDFVCTDCGTAMYGEHLSDVQNDR